MRLYAIFSIGVAAGIVAKYFLTSYFKTWSEMLTPHWQTHDLLFDVGAKVERNFRWITNCFERNSDEMRDIRARVERIALSLEEA
jgi:hypothetical protein